MEEKKDEQECKEKKNHWERAAYIDIMKKQDEAKKRYYVTFLKREWGKEQFLWNRNYLIQLGMITSYNPISS